MSGIFSSELFVEFSTILIFLLTIPLAALMTYKFFKKKGKSQLAWSIGLWLFGVGVLLEILFSFDFYNAFLIKFYLGSVAFLVSFLAFGSAGLLKNKKVFNYYGIFFILSGIFVIYSLVVSTIGNVLTNYVVFGVLPLLVVISSSVMTFPAAGMLIAVAVISYRKTSNKKMLSIIAGVIIVSVAGSLYIAHFPTFLYYSEFIGILLLWLGFI
ncbi:MAG: conserved hypothetical membrane protein [Candidatus Parvarchaeum acidiphilum ARMAN-4]|jgi:hypothetical protein|uniref:Conserved hypothetical membrane protein n=1 Tax=Candidatus Parvarchaeum acidiphilum ARMAN-4 TaxID=662760 RepID=D2EFD6_PARA4|nr:MAG: conserved hypothetical membrane protein [Candidatus Parvarchaeum acidiphilum ARMAN-4]